MTNKLIADLLQTDCSEPDGPSRSLVQYTSLTAYFHERLGEVRQNQNFDSTETSEFYVVNMLETFSNTEKLYPVDSEGKRQQEALATILHRAVLGSPNEQVSNYRRLGDMALFVAGFFAESLRRGAVGLGYYIDMGQGAYSALAGSGRGRDGKVFRELFEELADTFANWVEVLRELSLEIGLTQPMAAMPDSELFERWTRLQGPQAEALADSLIARGMMPMTKLHHT